MTDIPLYFQPTEPSSGVYLVAIDGECFLDRFDGFEDQEVGGFSERRRAVKQDRHLHRSIPWRSAARMRQVWINSS